MTEIDGWVTAVGNGELWVEVRPQTGCGRCHEPGGCGGGMLNGDGRVRNYRVSNAIGAVVGDRVLLGVENGAVLRGALIAYGIPGLLVIAGAAAGTIATGSDAVAAAGAVAGLLCGAGVLRAMRKIRGGDGVVLRVRRSDQQFQCERKT